jgi:hypothetical protein
MYEFADSIKATPKMCAPTSSCSCMAAFVVFAEAATSFSNFFWSSNFVEYSKKITFFRFLTVFVCLHHYHIDSFLWPHKVWSVFMQQVFSHFKISKIFQN